MIKKSILKETDSIVPVNSAGAGGVDGIGVGIRGEPGVKKRLKNIIKRKTLGEIKDGSTRNIQTTR